MSENNFPERTCIICRTKNEKKDFFRLAKIKDNMFSFDKEQKKQARGAYVCKSLTCLDKLAKHRKINVDKEELLQMLSIINKSNKNYLNILKSMKNSGELVFGINLLFENIKNIHFIILAQDIKNKNRDKILNKAKELNIPYSFVGNMADLGAIFDKTEVNVIGIKNKKMAEGLIN